MTISLPTLILSTVAMAMSSGITAQEATSSAAKRSSPPRPPIAVLNDPRPGPFIVRLNDRGEMEPDGAGVVANAVRNWSGEGLQAFTICFHPPVDRPGPADFKALEKVARALKANDANMVVAPDGGLCDPTVRRPTGQGSLVEIMGVLRL